MLTHYESKESQRDIRKRQHLMERSFARSTRYGFKRARWKSQWRVKIQELLTASLQNIMIYIRNVKDRATTAAASCRTRLPKPCKASNLVKLVAFLNIREHLIPWDVKMSTILWYQTITV